MREHDWGGMIVGLIFIIVGFGWILGNIYGFNFWTLIGTYWPVLFIVIGLSIIAKHYKKS